MNNLIKVRASQVGLLMTNPKGKSNLAKYTDAKASLDKKQKQLEGLSEKAVKTREKLEPEIDALLVLIPELEKVKDKIELSESAKSLAVQMYWDREHGIKKEITSKYFDKGNETEPDAIALAQRVNGWDAIEKNDEHYSNDFVTGTPDIVYNDLIPDTKVSWTAYSYPLFDTELKDDRYYWQIQTYLALTGRPKGVICFCLLDTPELLVMDEIYKYSRINGLLDTPPEIELEIRHAHNYSRLPENMRVKNFFIERDDEAIDEIYKRVGALREYYAELLASVPT